MDGTINTIASSSTAPPEISEIHVQAEALSEPQAEAVPEPAVRIAVIGTPRTGNTWLGHLLTGMYDLEFRAVACPAELDWSALPPRCLLQIHWHKTESFQALLRENGFHVLVPTRHPLDVLVSILHFALYDSSPARWLEGEEGEEGNEFSICGAMPCSSPFLSYAAGKRARALLSISQEWAAAGFSVVRYEDLVADTESELERIVHFLGVAPRKSLAEVIAANTLPKLRGRTGIDHHFWQGRPGLWKILLPTEPAQQIFRAQRSYFDSFAYACDADATLTEARASVNWIDLTRPSHQRKVEQIQELIRRREQLTVQLAESDALAADTQLRLEETSAVLADVRHHFHNYLERVGDVGPFTLRVVRTIHKVTNRYPNATSAIKRFLRVAG